MLQFPLGDQRNSAQFFPAYLLVLFLTKHAVAVPLHVSTATHNQAHATTPPAPMIPIWKRTLALSISNTPSTSESSHTVNALRSGPLAAVYRATLSTSSSRQCIATDPHKKCEVAFNGFGTLGEVHYTFNNSEKNLLGRSTQVLVSCRCLSKNCSKAILVRPINVLRTAQDGKPTLSKKVCLYEAVGNKFSDCHREMFRVSYRDRAAVGRNLTFGKENSTNVDYSVSDEHHGDFWTAKGNRYPQSQEECLDTDIAKLPYVNLTKISDNDIVFNDIDHSELPPCKPPAGVQYFRADEENEDEICGEIFGRTNAAATHIASQQDCFGVGKQEMSFMEPRSAILITNTELALVLSAALLGILCLWSVFWKRHRRGSTARCVIVVAIFVQIGISYLLEALPLVIALRNEIKGRDWISLIAFADATASHTLQGTNEDRILIVTIVLGEVQYLSTRVGLVAGLTGFFSVLALALGILILIDLSRSGHANQGDNGGSGSSMDSITIQSSAIIGEYRTVVRGRNSFLVRPRNFSLRRSRSFSLSETSTWST